MVQYWESYNTKIGHVMVNKSDNRTYSLELKLTRLSNFSRNCFIILVKLNGEISLLYIINLQESIIS